MTDEHSLIAAILEVARAKGLSQKTLAERSGIFEETLSRIKRRGSGNVAVVAKLARATGMRLGLVDAATLPLRHKDDRGSFRDRYAVALAWSNQNTSDVVLIRQALVNPRFQILLDAALEFGIEKLLKEWAQLTAAADSETTKARVTTERILGHIHDGYLQAAA
jgi:transcriptional regulator with XRE-family HTH domain